MSEGALAVYEAAGRIQKMRPGDRFCYFTGYLPKARLEDKQLDKLASFMLRTGLPSMFKFAADDTPVNGLGLGFLTQERIKSFAYDYYFTKW